MKTLKVLSALLTYPTLELQAAASEFKSVLRAEKALEGSHLPAVENLIDDIAGRDLYDAQERYILLFDRTRSLSLHLFEHVHGESRDRGQAMVDLIKVYEEAGLSPVSGQLPDFVPMFLEYAATRKRDEAIALVGQAGHIFAALSERLAKRRSPYGAVFSALVALSQTKLDAQSLQRLRAEPDPEPDDLEALDAAWEEEEVIFGPGSAEDACGKNTLGAKLRQARRPAPGLEPNPGARPRTVITYNATAKSPLYPGA